MNETYTITDKRGNVIREGDFTQAEIRMVAKAGYRVFGSKNREITPELTGLFDHPDSGGQY